MKKTLVISAFPGTGKTSAFNANKSLTILDSDSSNFSWISEGIRHPDFPQNYINHIKENIGTVDIIFVSSHSIVREALSENNIDFILIYPYRTLKEEYIERYVKRGSPEKFIQFISNNWDLFIDEMLNEKNAKKKIILGNHQYISNIKFSDYDRVD